MKTNRLAAGLDVGTTKVSVVVLDRGEGARPQMVGAGSAPSEGIRRGAVVAPEKAVAAIRRAVEDAERAAGVEIEEVYVGVAGDHIRSLNSRGVVAVSRPDHEISRADVDRVVDLARAVSIPNDREVLHVLPQDFSVDDHNGIRDAVGMCGMRLEAQVHIVTGATTSVQNVVKCVNRAGLQVADLVLQPLASGLSVLDEDEMELGAALIDVGGGTTDLAVHFGGSIRHSAVIGLGGTNVTNDIALGLRTPLPKAEDLKIEHGCAMISRVEEDYEITVPGVGGRPPRNVSRQLLAAIIEPRLEEIFTLACRELRKCEQCDLLGAGIVLTGGSSLMYGAADLAEQVFGHPVRVGAPHRVDAVTAPVDDPRLATSVGLALYGLRQQENGRGETRKGFAGQVVRGFRRWAADFF